MALKKAVVKYRNISLDEEYTSFQAFLAQPSPKPPQAPKMSLYKRFKPKTTNLVRIYDNSYCSSLKIPISKDNSSFYASTEDDGFITRYGGRSLSLSGCYLPGSEEYAVIESASILLFYTGGMDLNLLSKPFIINTTTFKEYSLEELQKSGIVNVEQIELIQKTLNKSKSRFEKRREIENKGGLAQYITFLRGMQQHIMSQSKLVD